jgi:hypothetical protein
MCDSSALGDESSNFDRFSFFFNNLKKMTKDSKEKQEGHLIGQTKEVPIVSSLYYWE